MHAPKPLVAVAVLSTGAAIVAFAVPGSAAAAQNTTIQVSKHVCVAPKSGHMSCDAMRLVTERVTAEQAKQLTAAGLARPATGTAQLGQLGTSAIAFGPAGGYSPAQIAKAYG
jgi:hypothetical protein